MRAVLLAEHYGPAHYGTISGAQRLALTGARTIAPVGAGILVAARGGYSALLVGLGGLRVLGAGAVLSICEESPAPALARSSRAEAAAGIGTRAAAPSRHTEWH